MKSSTEEQTAAWETYRAAKVKADASLDFRDGRTAALAWQAFAALFIEPASVDPLRHHKVTVLTGIRSPSPGGRRSHER